MGSNENNIFFKEYDVGSYTGIDRKKSDPEVSEEQIRDEYDIGPETKSEEEKPKSYKYISKPEIKVAVKKYGMGKPIRVILRGKLTHD